MGLFVPAGEEILFEAAGRQQLSGWLEQVLVGQQHARPARRRGAWCGATSRR